MMQLYPQLTKVFAKISADNGGCTVDEYEELLTKLTDEQLHTLAAGDESEQQQLLTELVMKSDDRETALRLTRSLSDFLNLAFD